MTSTEGLTSDALDLADRLSEIARQLAGEHDVTRTLEAVVRSGVETVPGASSMSITRVKRREQVETLVASSELARAADQAQYDAGEGPCLDALHQQRTVHLPDMRNEERWPAFTERARALGVGSMMAVRLYVEGDELGALNMSSEEPRAFSDDAEHVALLFASHAAVALAGAQAQSELRAGMETRDVIGTAKGVLMERFGLDVQQSFDLLVRASSHTNRKLVDIARQLVDGGPLPTGSQR